MLNNKCGMNETLSLDAKMFGDMTIEGHSADRKKQYEMFGTWNNLDGHDEVLIISGELNFFAPAEIKEIKSRINDYELCKARGNPQSHRGGGSHLSKEIALIANYKEKLLEHLEVIKDILNPKEKTRTTVKQAEDAATQAAVLRIAEAFSKMALIRPFAATLLGDDEYLYTDDELPLVMATKQITGVVLEPGKVL